MNGLFYLNSLDRSISDRTGCWSFFVITMFIFYFFFVEFPVFSANSVDPDQTLHFGESDLGPYCLRMSLLLDPRHKWVKAPGKFAADSIHFLFFIENKS